MDALVLVVWWISLILALALTVLILPVIVRIVFALREIDRLAKMALPAAAGIAENTAAIAALDDVLAQAGRLLGGVQAIGGATAGIRQQVAAVGAVLSRKGA